MSKEIVQQAGAQYLVSRTDRQVQKDIGKVMMVTGGGGIVALGIMSFIPFLPILLLILAGAGLFVYARA